MRTSELLPLLDAYAHHADAGYRRVSNRAGMYGFGYAVPFLPKRRPHGDKCDILLFSPSASWARRIAALEARLRESGAQVAHTIQLRARDIMRARAYRPPPKGVPVQWRFLAGYAEWLLESYQPKVLVTFADNDILSVFLKLSAERHGARVVNVSHSILVPHVLKSMFCFDYYFLLGDSSVDGARASELRFGDTRLAKTGYVLVDPALDSPPNPQSREIVFFSTWLYGGTSEHAIAYDRAAVRSMEILAAWAARRPDLRISVKTHPDEDPTLIGSLISGTSNVSLLPRGTGMRDALLPATLCIGMVTNAALESALMRRPFITLFEPGVLDNHLELDAIFGNRVFSVGELDAAVDGTLQDFQGALSRCEAFVQRHLDHPYDGLTATADGIIRVRERREPAGAVIPMEARLDLLVREP